VLALFALSCSDDSHRLGGEYEMLGGLRLGSCGHGAELESIDRMEDGDGTIDEVAGRGGVWLSFNDETGEQTPSDKAETFEMVKLRPPRTGSRLAARSQGEGFVVWGAGIGFELNNQQPYDLSRYAGLTFWARAGAAEPFVLRVSLPDRATAPRGGECAIDQCNDHFGADVRLTNDFERYTFLWPELAQSGYGEPRPDELDAAAVYAVHFQVAQNQDFDFTVDDIALVCRPD
jgi:hypothetical protein